MKTIGVLTSGGDAPGMNSAIRAVVRAGIYKGYRVLGIKEGYKGLMEGEIEEMELSSVADIIQRGGTMLRSARSEEFMTDEGFKRALNIIDVFEIDGLVVLGGDGSLKGGSKLAEAGVPIVGIPCTIDNDCGFTDYTIGFLTAVETVVDAISKIRDTSTSHGRANIIEVMGRDCGDLALYSGLAGGAESIILPEKPMDIGQVCKKAINGKNRGKLHHIIVLAEGVGDAYEWAEEIERITNIDTRVTILGYIQRGGSPSSFDRIIGSKMGYEAVELLDKGQYNRVLGIRNNTVVNFDIKEGLAMEKIFDNKMFEMTKILSI